jgi:hypothetical protein
MIKRFICLANSYKEGGRCLAGIELTNKNEVVFENGRPKWIRPICSTPHGEVPNELAATWNIMDLLEIDVIEYPDKNYQCENALFNEKSLKRIGTCAIKNYQKLCDDKPRIFGNRGKAVPCSAIDEVKFSLMLIHIERFTVIQKSYDDNQSRTQARMVFEYHHDQYDLPITDPVFLHSFQHNPNFFDCVNDCYLTISLGVIWNDWYYKLVAGVIEGERKSVIENILNDEDLPF